ncbi:MAG: hypothetical protein OIF55_16025 [Amphritea sp.]|nr:hypothetical protein [Amphritea sp.]
MIPASYFFSASSVAWLDRKAKPSLLDRITSDASWWLEKANSSQYQTMYSYLIKFFSRLAEKHLIDSEKCFTPEMPGLH